ncbi:MAG TPA: Hsp20/alpha crystallin family protein [Candidatus Binatia bacterium]|nr:Hsp20/alpha crystallin family protein [Candidatus Binatia bacterium]
MELLRWEPSIGWGDLRSVFNDLLEDNFTQPSVSREPSQWYPAVDILEGNDAYIFRAELPGMKREDIKVEVKDGTLVLSGQRKSEKPEGMEFRHGEIVAAQFWRSFSLPETARQDGIEATYKDGMLEIRIPKAEKAKPRQIEVNVH